MRTRIILPLALLIIGLGCSHPVTMTTRPAFSAPKHIVDSSAPIDSVAKAVVGNPILKVKDYWVTTQTDDSMTPSSGFTFTGGPNTIRVMDGQKLKIAGETDLDGQHFRVLRAPGSGMRILVDAATGTLHPRVINGSVSPFADPGDGIVMLWNFKAQPENITFTSSTLETVASSLTYVNYEFIYSGKSGNTISFLYREFTAGDLVKPAFSQAVTYETSEKIIQFKSIKLELLEVGSSTVSAKVLAL